MLTLKGEKVFLRALEPEDLFFLEQVENDESLWDVSSTQVPFSKFVLKKYLEQSHLDIYEVKQLRLVIVSQVDKSLLGLIDLFDFEPSNRKAGIGIIIAPSSMRRKGYALESLQLLIKYSCKYLKLHQLYANILEENEASIHLFEKAGFKKTALKKDCFD